MTECNFFLGTGGDFFWEQLWWYFGRVMVFIHQLFHGKTPKKLDEKFIFHVEAWWYLRFELGQFARSSHS